MALAAAVFLAMMAASRQSWRHLGWLVVIAGTVPIVYQVWRMSYYALPYPLTAVAKDAGGSKWDKGAEYLWDLLAPYVLLLPLVAVLVAGLGTAVLVGLSRLYLGVHYPLDVLASFPVAWAGLAVGCGLANHLVPALEPVLAGTYERNTLLLPGGAGRATVDARSTAMSVTSPPVASHSPRSR